MDIESHLRLMIAEDSSAVVSSNFAKVALDKFNELRAENARLQSIIDEANAQDPVGLPFVPWLKEIDFFDSMKQSPAVAVPVGYREEWKRNVMLMWSCVRKHDSSIPSDVLDYMREQLLAKLNEAKHD